MVRYKITLRNSHECFCDHCQKFITPSDLILVRDAWALPEEPTYHFHTACLDKLTKSDHQLWERFEIHSEDAGWLV